MAAIASAAIITGAMYPDAPPSTAQMKMPAPDEVALFRVVPQVISVLDYTKGFAHTDLVSC